MNNLVTLNVWGDCADFIGYKKWELNVKSVQEALHALNTLTKNKFNEYFIKKNKLNAKYRILINGKDFTCPVNEINDKNLEMINQSELVMNKNNLQTIDIVPLIESAKNAFGIITAILGAILIIVGIFVVGFTPFGIGLIIAGIGLLGAGIVSLLSKPPPFSYNQNLDNATSQSYLFNGPTNTVGEGNPVPIGYGTFLVGSNVISAGYKITEFQTYNQGS
jgi:predicted phage tail protein